MEDTGLRDPRAVLRRATGIDNGNRYLNRGELTAAAQQEAASVPRGYRWSESVVVDVMAARGIANRGPLLREATKHDDGNRYLKRAEIDAAARAVNGQGNELGVISDLDKTIIPPHTGGLPDAAYPGVSTLLDELEFADDGLAGDTYYVTARTPSRAAGVRDWLTGHGLPAGEIETGVSGVPWVAEKEKVKDISAIIDANPNQTFVLFGDSSHRDPEVFKKIVAKYPGRIAAAFVHRVNNVNPNRVSGLTPIDEYATAAATLYQAGRLDEAAARRVMTAAKNEGLPISNADINALIASHQPPG